MSAITDVHNGTVPLMMLVKPAEINCSPQKRKANGKPIKSSPLNQARRFIGVGNVIGFLKSGNKMVRKNNELATRANAAKNGGMSANENLTAI